MALESIAHWICRAYRRALRRLGVPGIAPARRLGLLSGLPAPPWLLPDPDLSQTVRRLVLALPDRLEADCRRVTQASLRRCRALLRVAGGRSRIHRSLVPA